MGLGDFNFDKRDVALMYSGGLDTTLAAATLAQNYRRIHLITFCNGFCIRLERSQIHVLKLKEKYGPDKFIHRTIYITELFSGIRNEAWPYSQKFKSPLVFDLCCRLSMEAAMIIYCLENNINVSADGNNLAQDEIFLQHSEYLKAMRKFYGQYHLELIHPVYQNPSRHKRDLELKNLGIDDGRRFLTRLGISSQLFNQPFCLHALITYCFTSWVRHLPFICRFSLALKDALILRDHLEPLAERHIKNHFEKKPKDYCCFVLPASQKGFEIVTNLKKNGLPFEIVPRPKGTLHCGIAIKINLADQEKITTFLNAQKVDWAII